MTIHTKRLAELLKKESKGTKVLTVGEQNELYNLFERMEVDITTTRKTVNETIITTLNKFDVKTIGTLDFLSPGTIDLDSNTLTLGADLTTTGSNLILNSSGAYTLNISGSPTLAGSGELTLTTNLTNQGGAGVLAWPAGGATLTVGATSSISGNIVVAADKTLTCNNSLTIYGNDGALVEFSLDYFNVTRGDGYTYWDMQDGACTLSIYDGTSMAWFTSLTNQGGAGTLTWPVAGATLTVAGDASVSGTNTGDVTLADESGLTLTNQVIGVNKDYAFVWTGAHTFQDTITTRNILPEATDTYDIGSTIKLYRKGYLSELDALIFAENTISVIGGWFYICKDQGTLPTELSSVATTYDFGKAMTPNDFLAMRGLLMVEYIQVGALVTGTTYNITRNLDGSGANTWPAGACWADLGYSTHGRLELNASDTPRIQLIKQGTSYNAQTELMRMGDLNGNWGYSSETYGVAIGARAASTPNLTVDSTNGIRIFNNATQLGQWDTSGNVLIGQASASQGNVYITSGAIQLRNNTTVTAQLASNGDFTFGEVGASKFNLMWDASEGDLLMRSNTTAYFQVDGSASLLKFGSDVSAAATTAIAVMGAAQTYNSESLGVGDLLIGDNTAGYANILWDKDAKQLKFRGGTTPQAYIDTDGALAAGGGAVKLDSSGIKLLSDVGLASRINIYNGATLYDWIQDTSNAGAHSLSVVVEDIALKTSTLDIDCAAPATYLSTVSISANSGGDLATFALLSDSNATPVNQATLGCQLDISGLLIVDTNSTTALVVEQDGVKDNVLVVDTTNAAVSMAATAKVNYNSTTALLVERDGVKDNVLVVDTTNARVGLNCAPVMPLHNYHATAGDPATSGTTDANVGVRFQVSSVGLDIGTYGDGSTWIQNRSVGNLATNYALYLEPNGGNVYLGAGSIVATATGYLGVNDVSPGERLDVNGNANVTGVYKVDDVQVVGNRVVNATFTNNADDVYGAVEKNLINGLVDALIAHGLIAAA